MFLLFTLSIFSCSKDIIEDTQLNTKNTQQVLWNYNSENYDLKNYANYTSLTNNIEETTIYKFDDINSIVNFSSNEETQEITIESDYYEKTYKLKNLSVDYEGNQMAFTLYEDDQIIDEGFVLSSDNFQVSNYPCPFCSLVAAVAANISQLIGAVREDRRLTVCEEAMADCRAQGRTPEVTVTDGGGCSVKCTKDGSE